MDAHPPEIVEEPTADLELLDARHPLLMPELAERLGIARTKEPVPVSLRVGGDEPVLVISGPNTGGKTVALKTVGLFALMAQCGLHVPAAPGSRLPVFRRVFADIGDEQSIAENLSTFSSHLAAIVEMTRDLALPALVLLDEVGAGTDPTEGGALGVAIVEHFRKSGAMVLATTHHGLMKAYAQSTPGVACAPSATTRSTYEPTYRLTLGAPGRSLALEMAERLGLPAEVVADARSRRDDKEQQAEALLARLEQEQAELEREQVRIEGMKAEAEGARARTLLAEREIVAKKRREVEVFARDLKRRAEEAETQGRRGDPRGGREGRGGPEGGRRPLRACAPRRVAAIRDARDEVLQDPELGLPEEQEAPAQALAVGMRVRVKAMGVTGEVMALQGDDAEVAVSGKRLRVPQAELVALRPSGKGRGGPRGSGAEPPRLKSQTKPSASRSSPESAPLASRTAFPPPPHGGGVSILTKQVPAELNLIGLTVDEARERVDKLLDDAALSDRREIRVIHGFGEGKLRKAVAADARGPPARRLVAPRRAPARAAAGPRSWS